MAVEFAQDASGGRYTGAANGRIGCEALRLTLALDAGLGRDQTSTR